MQVSVLQNFLLSLEVVSSEAEYQTEQVCGIKDLRVRSQTSRVCNQSADSGTRVQGITAQNIKARLCSFSGDTLRR